VRIEDVVGGRIWWRCYYVLAVLYLFFYFCVCVCVIVSECGLVRYIK